MTSSSPGTAAAEPTHPGTTRGAFVERLRAMAFRGLARMYVPGEGRFVFRLRRVGDSVVPEGRSPRYSAISLIGLAEEDPAAASRVLAGATPADVARGLLGGVAATRNLGDVALILWAAARLGVDGREGALRRLVELDAVSGGHPTVEVAWSLSALVEHEGREVTSFRRALAERLATAISTADVFPHVLTERGGGLRGHVACFADMVYPVQALARHQKTTGDPAALTAAERGADFMCARQGAAGQWWWHYDARTGDVLDGYPVYAIHQDAMGPMALLAVMATSKRDYTANIDRSLAWLESAPELDGASLVDDRADLIWRKVARREPRKATRYLQAAASAIHPGLRFPGTDVLFPPRAVDYEDRPYHLGWLMHAFPGSRTR
jgi:hypothetical protein